MCRLNEEMEESAPVKPVCVTQLWRRPSVARQTLTTIPSEGEREWVLFFFAGFSFRRPQPPELFNESYRVYDARESCSCLRSARLINRVITLIALSWITTRFVGGPWGRTQAAIAGHEHGT